MTQTANTRKQLGDLERIRQKLRIQLSAPKLLEILNALRPPANFLVFGAGNDSAFWAKSNPGGATVFIEDNAQWFQRIETEHPDLTLLPINYHTTIEQWRELLNQPKKLRLRLPRPFGSMRWDLILVDAPAGFGPGTPGRMRSIYTASRLIRPGGAVFVDDCERQVERAYADKFLGRKNLVSEIRAVSTLRHYRF